MVEVAPDSFVGYSNLGAAYLAMGRYAEAIPPLNRSIEIRPVARALSNLGATYVYQKRFAEAVRTYEKAVKLDEKNDQIWGFLAWAYYWTPGERPKAARAYQRAVELAEEKLIVNPRDSSLLRQLAVNTAMLGNRQAAMSYLERARVLAPHDADLEFQAAAVYAHFGEGERTLQCLQKAVSWGFSRTTILNTPDFDKFRSDSRFQKLTSES